jgi:hypothetical protein
MSRFGVGLFSPTRHGRFGWARCGEMTETLPHEDGSSLTLAFTRNTVSLSLRGPEAPASPPITLTLAEVEALQKALGVLAAKVRGVNARAA